MKLTAEMIERVRCHAKELRSIQPRVMRILRRHKFVFNRFPRDLKKSPPKGDAERWECLAFTLYSEICRADSIATAILAAAQEEEK